LRKWKYLQERGNIRAGISNTHSHTEKIEGEEEEGGRGSAAEHGDSGCLHGYETTKQHGKLY